MNNQLNAKPVYIHYGSNKFKTPEPILNKVVFTKPSGGLWASRKGDPNGWKNWCIKEDFLVYSLNKSFEFTLKDNARVLKLENREQLVNLPYNIDNKYDTSNLYNTCYLDFEELSKDYDAIELMDIHEFYFALYGWDCNSILIMNPDVIDIISEED